MSCFINNTSENGVNQFAPFSIIAKPVGSTCNLRCKYCYYIDKASELGYNRRPPSNIMRSGILNNQKSTI